jgi:mannose-1-phosphate guanylyltransferase
MPRVSKASVFSVILAGGASSRLFPFNKILADLTGTGKTLIQQAAERARAISSKKETYVLSVKDLVAPIRVQLALSKEKFFIDPVRRGTWPALLWAMAHLRRKNPEAVLAVLTGDQIIARLPAFHRAAARACRLARENPAIVMLGVAPDSDAARWTEFGVFRVAGNKVSAFSEKPARARAELMIREGGWQLN